MRFSYCLPLAFCGLLTACGDPSPESTEAAPSSVEAVLPELSAAALSEFDDDASISSTQPVPLADAVRPLNIQLLAETGYRDADNLLVLDVMQQDSVYLMLLIEDAEGRTVEGAEPEIRVDGTSEVARLFGHGPATDASGGFRFGVVGGEMGEDEIIVTLGDISAQAILNVISLAATGYDNLADIEGVLPWSLLMQAQISWGEETMSAVFPPEVQTNDGQTVKLAGFMMPLEMTEEQSRFALTSNPRSCFFHIPGGPAGAVEVFAAKPVAVTWDPVVLEGRFEALDSSEMGVAYRLHEARLVE